MVTPTDFYVLSYKCFLTTNSGGERVVVKNSYFYYYNGDTGQMKSGPVKTECTMNSSSACAGIDRGCSPMTKEEALNQSAQQRWDGGNFSTGAIAPKPDSTSEEDMEELAELCDPSSAEHSCIHCCFVGAIFSTAPASR
jgi:hypothetical protein